MHERSELGAPPRIHVKPTVNTRKQRIASLTIYKYSHPAQNQFHDVELFNNF